MTYHTFLSCTNCQMPIVEVKCLNGSLFLIAGARCKKCGEAQVLEDNGFNYSKFDFSENPIQLESEQMPQ